MDALLIFPPGWTLASGGAHIALPLLKATLIKNGFEAQVRDLNWEAGLRLGAYVDEMSAHEKCLRGSLAEMNEPYFAAEDTLTGIAAGFDGQWNAQLGFEYNDFPQISSRQSLASIGRASPFDYLFDDVVGELERNPPAIIGFCLAATQQIVPTLQLCARMRSAGFRGFIVLGGNTVSRLADELAISSVFNLVDGLITFQGEMPLVRLCETISSGKSLECVPQLIWREGQWVRRNGNGEALNPDLVPTPDYRGLPVGQYWGTNYINLLGARGCYYGKCSFCAIPFGWGNGGYSGARSVELVYRDMVALTESYGINRFKFVDEALSPRFMRELSTRILTDAFNVEWEGYTRLEQAWLDLEFVELVGRAGFRKGYFGLEVVPSRQRSVLNKRDSAQPELLLQICEEAGVKTHLFCMFGYPGTGEEEAKRTTDFVLEHRDLIDTADIFPWTYAKHTRVPGASIVFQSDQDWALEFQHIGARPDVLSSREVVELAARYEEIIWSEAPRLLHPTYRLVSPWKRSNAGGNSGAVHAKIRAFERT